MSLGQIASSISNTVASFANVFSFNKTGPYQHFEGITNRIEPQNWKLSLPYSFQVVGVSSPLLGANSPLSGIFQVVGQPTGGGLFDEFILPFNPQDINQEDTFAISVTPLQGGIISEHNGMVLKDLTISGTTGMRPTSTQSGYELFQTLRNYLRSYAQLKKNPDQKNAQLLFVNKKDNETFVVEPQRFTMRRSYAAPFLYNYTINLKVLGIKTPTLAGGILGDFLNKIDAVLDRVNTFFQQARYIFNSTIQLATTIEREFVNTLLAPIENAGLAVKSLLGLGYTVADIPRAIISEFSSRTIASFLDAGKALKRSGNENFSNVAFPADTLRFAIENGHQALSILNIEQKDSLPLTGLTEKEKQVFNDYVNKVNSLPKKFYQDLQSENNRIRDNSAEKFGVGDSRYNAFIGRTSTFTPDPNKVPFPNEIEFLSAFNYINKALNLMLSSDILFHQTIDNYVNDVKANYDDSLNIDSPNSVDEILLPPDTTLEDLASEFLGHSQRWIEIAIVNNLVAPYIDENSTDERVKKPGEKILIPRSSAPELSNIPNANTILITENLSQTEKNLGVDFKLDKNFDFILNNNHDFELIAGGPNAGQAVVLKLGIERGSLKCHPEIGVGINIGEKIRNGDDVRNDMINTILSDNRFTGIKNLTFMIDGNTINIALDLIVKHISTPIPINFNV